MIDHDIWFALEEKLRRLGDGETPFAASVAVAEGGHCRVTSGGRDCDGSDLPSALIDLVAVLACKGRDVPDFTAVDCIEIERIENLLRRLAPPRATMGFLILGRGYCRAAWDVSSSRGEPIIEMRAPTLDDLGIEMIARLNAARSDQ